MTMANRIQMWRAALLGLTMTVGPSALARPYRDAPDGPAIHAEAALTTPMIEGCILAASKIHQVPPAVLVILLNVERGMIGLVSQNPNGTVDIGPMQVNEIWLPQLAQHWHASVPDTLRALRDIFCANVEGGAWILRLALNEAHGDFWRGVAIYHSHDPGNQTAYLRQVLRQALRLEVDSGATQHGSTRLAARN
jgi:hypothetical protein